MSARSDLLPLDPSEGEVPAVEVKRRLDAGEPLLLLDVREPHELALCRIDGAKSIPLAQLPAKLATLPKDRAIVVFCHLGARSWQGMAYLRNAGFPSTWSMAGGVHAWALQVDRSMRTY